MTQQRPVKAATLARARELAHEMLRDPIIRPHLKSVAQYQSYHRFRIAHRAHWEQSTRYERYYQEKLFALADKESSRHGFSNCDSVTNWDEWYHAVLHPIKTALWETWEKSVNLERRYMEALLASGQASAAQLQTIVDTDLEPAAAPMQLAAARSNGGTFSTLMRFLHLAN